MNIQDNILKHYLKNVYFVCGTACGGKSTLSRALAEKHGHFVLANNKEAEQYRKELAN